MAESGRGEGPAPVEQKDLLRQELLAALNKMDSQKALLQAGKLGSPRDVFATPEIREVLKQGMVTGLRDGKVEAVSQLMSDANLSEEEMQSPELQAAARIAMMRGLQKASIGAFERVEGLFSVPRSYAESPEVVREAYTGIATALLNNLERLAPAVEARFGISRTDIICNAYVADKKAGTEFYKAVLGAEQKRLTGDRPLVTIVGSEPKPFYGKIFLTDDLEVATAKVLAAGGSIVETEAVVHADAGEQKYFKDVDGNIFALHKSQ